MNSHDTQRPLRVADLPLPGQIHESDKPVENTFLYLGLSPEQQAGVTDQLQSGKSAEHSLASVINGMRLSDFPAFLQERYRDLKRANLLPPVQNTIAVRNALAHLGLCNIDPDAYPDLYSDVMRMLGCSTRMGAEQSLADTDRRYSLRGNILNVLREISMRERVLNLPDDVRTLALEFHSTSYPDYYRAMQEAYAQLHFQQLPPDLQDIAQALAQSKLVDEYGELVSKPYSHRDAMEQLSAYQTVHTRLPVEFRDQVLKMMNASGQTYAQALTSVSYEHDVEDLNRYQIPIEDYDAASRSLFQGQQLTLDQIMAYYSCTSNY